MQGLTLINPSTVTFGPGDKLNVCDAYGTVYVASPGGDKKACVPGFDTECWKSDDTGKKWYRAGMMMKNGGSLKGR